MLKQVVVFLGVLFFTVSSLYSQDLASESIPSGALAVVSVRAGQLLNKANLKKLENTAGMKATMEKYRSYLQKEAWPNVLGDLGSIGLDSTVPWYIAFYSEGLIVGITTLKDQNKWVNWIQKVEISQGRHLEEGKEYTYYRSDDELLVAWGKGMLLLLQNEKEDRDIEAAFLKRFFHPDGAGFLLQKKTSFQKHLAKDWDLSIWIDLPKLQTFLSNQIDSEGKNTEFLSFFREVSGESATIEMVFQPGFVNVKYRFFMTDSLRRLYIGNSIGETALALYPAGIPLGEMALNLDSDRVGSVLRMIPSDSDQTIEDEINDSLRDQGWSVDKLFALLDGRVLLALYEQSGSDWPYEGVLILPLRDEERTLDLLELFCKQGVLIKASDGNGNHYVVVDEDGNFPGELDVRVKNGKLLLETSGLLDKEDRIRGTVSGAVKNLYRNNYWLLRVDIPAVIRAFPTDEENESAKMVFQAMVNGRIDGFSMSAGQEGDDMVVQTRLETGMPTQNSLFSLLSWYGDLLFDRLDVGEVQEKDSNKGTSMRKGSF